MEIFFERLVGVLRLILSRFGVCSYADPSYDQRLVERLVGVVCTIRTRFGARVDANLPCDRPRTESSQLKASCCVNTLAHEGAGEPVRLQECGDANEDVREEGKGETTDEALSTQSSGISAVADVLSTSGELHEAAVADGPSISPDVQSGQEMTSTPIRSQRADDKDPAEASDGQEFLSILQPNHDEDGSPITEHMPSKVDIEPESDAVLNELPEYLPSNAEGGIIGEELAESVCSLAVPSSTAHQSVEMEDSESPASLLSSTGGSGEGGEGALVSSVESNLSTDGGSDQPSADQGSVEAIPIESEWTVPELSPNDDLLQTEDSGIEYVVSSDDEIERQSSIESDVSVAADNVSPSEQIQEATTASGEQYGLIFDQEAKKPAVPRNLKSEGIRKVRSPREPAPAESAEEFKTLICDISVEDQEYARWNKAVIEQILLVKPPSECVYLSITPWTLAGAFSKAGFDVLEAEQAERRFVAAIAGIYRKRVLTHSERLRVLRRCGDDGSPDCAAFIAATVLAAYHMQSDEDVSGNAYYRRLADLLGCELAGAHPVGFNTLVFESLWVFLGNWLHTAHGRQLATPRSDVGLRRFIALPLAHVPLRSLDIEKLPAFFVWAGYQPGSRVSRDRLLDNLQRWQRSRNALTHTGAEAILDDRSDAVLAQVSAELESWDGSFSESSNRKSALVEIQFDIVQRLPAFSYLPRRPLGFPTVFDDGEHVFEASDEGWYDPLPLLPADGELLASGFEWRSFVNRTQFILRRSETLVVPLTPSSSYSGFLSSRHLLRGVRCSVLCRDDLVGWVEEYLSDVAQQPLKAVRHPSMPNGWCIVRDFKPEVYIAAPTGLEVLEVDPNIDLLVSGGLRIGRRWSWLAGAPPSILVSGLDIGEGVKLNGVPIEVNINGELMVDGKIAEPGEYLLEAGRTRRRIEVLAPQMTVRYGLNRWGAEDSNRPEKIALPRGSWTLVGASPGEVWRLGGVSMWGTLASCPFHPIWAVQVAAGPGAQVAVLAKPEPPKEFDVRRVSRSAHSKWEQWASVIYNANIRRPCFYGVDGMVSIEIMQLLWRQYAEAAKQIKRALKRNR